MASVVISFLIFLCIPMAAVIGLAMAGAHWFRKPKPSARGLIRDCLLSGGISVGIALGISLVFTWTGFLEAQFYRPSARDYAEQTQLGVTPEDVFFESGDGTRLHGWFVPSKGESFGTVVHFHGSDRNITYTIRNVHWLRDHGFNLFLFDYRGFGKSEGKPSRRGVVEDAVAAIDYVRSRPDLGADAIWLWGQSLGGQLAIVAAGMAATPIVNL